MVLLTNDEMEKRSILVWVVKKIDVIGWKNYINDEKIEKILLCEIAGNKYRHGFHFWSDIEYDEEWEGIFISANGKDNKELINAQEDDYLRIYKIVTR